ncbi:MAG TPA: 50S ribosomal protein L18 [Nitrospinaceae bacterium]|nr:50S ribosomal protein L18 [Nitrospinota bacterium]MDP6336283.1 50S ribosomal protein L18 [Nitrospinaceae bacterium]HAX45451.1 50S ribosomal protein L18 [Nitrospina sp.]MDP7148325.1 50S ribosomal protein L18 [Nitrospinaceae bacterium]MDP7610939.1 50S ribosomal protein L18 [Nitrospinaceae bacterium]|tara:strand:- start:157 stop:522 length:366 start_codon:yes stop_codon:yes gene_type:complete
MKTSNRERLRINRKRRVKNRVQRNREKLRLTVFRSAKHIYAQIINDMDGKTLLSESTMSPAFREKLKNGGNAQAATLVGNLLGEKAVQQGIKEVYYDRNGFTYAGRVKALADGVREKGVKF